MIVSRQANAPSRGGGPTVEAVRSFPAMSASLATVVRPVGPRSVQSANRCVSYGSEAVLSCASGSGRWVRPANVSFQAVRQSPQLARLRRGLAPERPRRSSPSERQGRVEVGPSLRHHPLMANPLDRRRRRRPAPSAAERGELRRRVTSVSPAIALLAALAVSATAQAPAHAEGMNKAEARRQVADMELHHGRLLDVFPALTPVDRAVRGDCATKAPGRASSDRFCKCAVAVVFGRWRANVDPAVLKGLQEVALKSVPHEPAEFVAKQGPEIYADLCSTAGRR